MDTKLGLLEGGIFSGIGEIAGGDIVSGLMDNIAYRLDSVVSMVTLEGGFHNFSGPLDRRMAIVKNRRKLFGLPKPMLGSGTPLLHGGGGNKSTPCGGSTPCSGSRHSSSNMQKKQSIPKTENKQNQIVRARRSSRNRNRDLRQARQTRNQSQARQTRNQSQERRRSGRGEESPISIESLREKYNLQ